MSKSKLPSARSTLAVCASRSGTSAMLRPPRAWSAACAMGAAMPDSTARLRHDADIGLGRLPTLRVLLLGILVRHRAGDDHVLPVVPVHRRRHLVLGSELQRV